MHHRRGNRRRLVALICVGLVAVTAGACGSQTGRAAAGPAPGLPRSPGSPGSPGSDQVVVASFNFPESELLAEIYAQGLAAAGVPVRTELDLGTREMVMPAFQEGLVDLVPEYLGSALQALEPDARIDMSDPSAVVARLDRQLARWSGRALTPSPGQDQNGLVVTRATAARYGLRSVSDLARLGDGLTLTGPPECPERPYCLIGFGRVYGLRFARFVPLDTEQERVTALDQGVAAAAVIFTTSGTLADGDLVLLADDRRLQPAEHVTPIVSDRAVARFGARLTDVVDRISARLSTGELVFLNWRTGEGGRSPATEAHGWLVRQGLVPRPSKAGLRGR